MSFLRGSLNYVWCTTSVLGRGATGAVFQGVNKNTGESVAVKTFNSYSHMRPQEVQMREFEVLQKVNHENIVKLLEIEDDEEGRGKVIVMELCTGGSLFNILDDPENTYGLSETEFLYVLEHLCAGMKHLRDNNLVHRDLKPGNIMKFISEDGQTIYKLTDFGAARELEENQPFASLYGTEEYLHPDMYERAVLRRSINRSFTANVDLWSIGVTLFHVATGNLPFRPYGGRKNRETMHQITTRKASGVISGTQLTENGPIEWSRTLPPHCQLSAGLKTLVTPLLAGLLEENRERTWSFDRFFEEVTLILRKRLLHVFFMNRTLCVEIFLEPEEQLDNFKEAIFLQTEVSPANQILIFNNAYFESKINNRLCANNYPKTETEAPIFLYSIENNNVQLPNQLDLPKFPTFPSNVSVENDASLAKASCSVGHECKRRVETFTTMDILMKKGVEQFIETLNTTITLLLRKTNNFDKLISTVVEYGEFLFVIANNNDMFEESYRNLKAELKELKRNFDSSADIMQQLYNNYVVNETLSQEWRSAMHGKMCPCKSRASQKAKHLVDRLRDSWQHLLRDRATRTLTYNDEQFHALEKIKVDRKGKKLKSLLMDDVKPTVALMAECLADWYKLAQTVYLKTEILEKDIRDCDRLLQVLHDRLDQIKSNLLDIKQVPNNSDQIQNNWMELKNSLLIWRTHQNDVNMILNQNKELLEKVKSLGISNFPQVEVDNN